MKTRTGFSLVELLIVMAVTSMLLGVGVGKYVQFRCKAEAQAAVADLQQAQEYIESFKQLNRQVPRLPGQNGYPGTTIEGLAPDDTISEWYEQGRLHYQPHAGTGEVWVGFGLKDTGMMEENRNSTIMYSLWWDNEFKCYAGRRAFVGYLPDKDLNVNAAQWLSVDELPAP